MEQAIAGWLLDNAFALVALAFSIFVLGRTAKDSGPDWLEWAATVCLVLLFVVVFALVIYLIRSSFGSAF